MTSKPRTVLLGSTLAVAALVASGCQSRVGTAADVGSSRISTHTLDDAVSLQANTANGKQATDLPRQVLSQLVLERQVQELAKSRGVTVAPGDVASTAATYKAAAAAGNDEPDSYWQEQGRETATVVAVMADYAAKTGKVDAVNLYAVPVKDGGTGEKVLGLLSKDPSAKAAIAKQYSASPQLAAVGGQAGINSIDQLGVPALKTMKKDDATIATIQGSIYVLVVQDRLDAADFTTALNAIKVKVNPRFGTWGATANNTNAVVAATNPLAKADPSKQVDAPSPTASAAPPSASAPSS